ncbi:hypothetical protein ACFLQ5_00340 [Bacteroidota bacterium]
MTNETFIDKVIEYYDEARHLTFANYKNQIIRGKSHTISGKSEDLFAYWLAEKLDINNIQYWVDKPISFHNIDIGRKTTIQPDVLIDDNSIVKCYFDIKMDLGWKRDLTDYLNQKNNLISKIRNKECWIKIENEHIEMEFSNKIKYQIIVLCGENISREKMEENNNCASTLDNVELYILSGNQHLNMYKKQQERDKLEIYEDAFDKLISDTKELLK